MNAKLVPTEHLTSAIARAWCHPENSSKEMDKELIAAIEAEVNTWIAANSNAAAPEAEGAEPVAWRYSLAGDDGEVHFQDAPFYPEVSPDLKVDFAQPLYAVPQNVTGTHISGCATEINQPCNCKPSDSPAKSTEGVTPMKSTPEQYALALLETMASKFVGLSPHWKPLPDLLGMLTQIDNISAGVRFRADCLEISNKKLLGAFDHLRNILRRESGYDAHEVAAVINAAIDSAVELERPPRAQSAAGAPKRAYCEYSGYIEGH